TAAAGKYSIMKTRVLATGKKVKAEHKFINALTVQLGESDVDKLESDPSIAHISLDHVVRSTAAPGAPGAPGSPAGPPQPPQPPSPPAVNPMDDVMLATLGLTNSSITGKGVGVAIVDSGLQPSTDLPAFAFSDLTTNTSGSA